MVTKTFDLYYSTDLDTEMIQDLKQYCNFHLKHVDNSEMICPHAFILLTDGSFELVIPLDQIRSFVHSED